MTKLNLGEIGILGDSYSTFKGYIPSGYAVYYDVGVNGLKSADDTWWKVLESKVDGKIKTNCSFSGSTVCNTGYDACYCPYTSFIGRMKDYFDGREKYDTILIYGGTNDSWADSPVGETTSTDFSEDNLRNVFPAFSYMLTYLKDKNPETRIVVIINDIIRQDLIDGIIEICNRYEIEYLVTKDVSKENSHPDVVGMKTIAEEIIGRLLIK